MRHDSYLPASPATLQALGRMEYAIVNTIASPDVSQGLLVPTSMPLLILPVSLDTYKIDLWVPPSV